MSLSNLELLIQSLDKETLDNCQNVKYLANRYSQFLGKEQILLEAAAAVHDIGRMYIAPRLLHKEGNLNGSELEAVRLHPYFGYLMVMEHGISAEIAQLVLYHHGKNPYHLQPIPPPVPELMNPARVLHTLDVYNALTSPRSYRDALPADEALEIMRKEQKMWGNYSVSAMEMLDTI